MSRAKFKSGNQRKFIDKVIASTESVSTIARICGVSERTVRDWRREKYHIDTDAMLLLAKRYNIHPGAYRLLQDGWHLVAVASLGGIMRIKEHGAPSTLAGRKKGGAVSQERRREDPERYRRLGCIVRKKWIELVPSEDLAELFGILIGDGGISDYQVGDVRFSPGK